MTTQELTYLLKGIDRSFSDTFHALCTAIYSLEQNNPRPFPTVRGNCPTFNEIKELVDELTNLRTQYKHYHEQLTSPNVHSTVAGNNASVHSGQANDGYSGTNSPVVYGTDNSAR